MRFNKQSVLMQRGSFAHIFGQKSNNREFALEMWKKPIYQCKKARNPCCYSTSCQELRLSKHAADNNRFSKMITEILLCWDSNKGLIFDHQHITSIKSQLPHCQNLKTHRKQTKKLITLFAIWRPPPN